jgi:hypothetical protein
MRAAEILRKLADVVDAAEQGGEVDQLGRSAGSEGGDAMSSKTMQRMEPVDNDMPGERTEEAPEPELGKMVPPLQQELELEKKEAGVESEFDSVAREGGEDELSSIKRFAGL